MAKFKKGLAGARDRVRVLMKTKPLQKRLRSLAIQSPKKARIAMGQACAWWHAQLLPKLPVRASFGRYAKIGRGQLKKRTQPWVKATADSITGGIRSMVPYAIWLFAGTRRIAGGRVMKWKPGRPTITDWPAKAAGGNPRGELPIIVPWHTKARAKLRELLRKALLK